MNKILGGLIVIMLSLPSISYADGVVIPGSIKVEAFIKDMKEHGMDLSGSDSSDGYVDSLGNSIKVITYKPVALEQMELMKEVAFKNVRK